MDSTSTIRLIAGCRDDIASEFRRQGRQTAKYLSKGDKLQKLYDYTKKKFPEYFEKAKKKDLATIRKEVDKLLDGWADYVDPEDMDKVLESWQDKAAIAAGNKALQELGMRIGFNLRSPALINELRKRGTEITGEITEKTLNDLRKKMVEGYVEKGLNPHSLAREIKGMFEETYKNRSKAIARTEVRTAQEITSHMTYVKNGLEYKMWRAIMDAVTRLSHEEVNGMIMPIEEPFIVNGYEMMHPLDGSLGAPAGEIVNCRCDEIPILEGWNEPADAWRGDR